LKKYGFGLINKEFRLVRNFFGKNYIIDESLWQYSNTVNSSLRDLMLFYVQAMKIIIIRTRVSYNKQACGNVLLGGRLWYLNYAEEWKLQTLKYV